MSPLMVAVIAIRVVWAFTILIGTAYVVFWLGHSGWWWVPSIILIACASNIRTVTEPANR